MPDEKGIITAIDVGTTKVCTIIASRSGARGFRVLGHSTVPCDGVRKGNVRDVPATTAAIRRSVQDVVKATGHEVESAFVGVTGSHIRFQNRRDRLTSVAAQGVITAGDLSQTPGSLSESLSEPGRRLLHAVRMSYTVDGEAGIRNPLGMHSNDVEAETHLVTGGAALINKLVQAVENAGIKITALVLEPLAGALAVLTPEEKERGAVIVDIGGGTTDLVGFRKGRICYSSVIPVAGFQFTNDIAITYSTPYEAAEAVKLRYASTDIQMSGLNEEISLPVNGRAVELQLNRLDICQLTRERAQELARLVKIKLDEAEMDDCRVVLTGGASNMPGLAELMQRTLTVAVRQGIPNVNGGVPDEIRGSAYATGVGILLWATTEYVPPPSTNNDHSRPSEALSEGLLSRLRNRLGRLTRALIKTSKERN